MNEVLPVVFARGINDIGIRFERAAMATMAGERERCKRWRCRRVTHQVGPADPASSLLLSCFTAVFTFLPQNARGLGRSDRLSDP
jgi:hypothetical protein